MRMLVWNILHGGGPRRTPGIALAILAHQPDVVVLTEFRTTLGGQLAGVLHDHGLQHRIDSAPKPKANGLCIASRWPLSSPQIGQESGLDRKLMSVQIEAINLRLAAVHVPDARAHDATAMERKSGAWNELLHLARQWQTHPAVLTGDLNTGRPGLDEDHRTLTSAPLLGKLTAMGYADAYRTLHPRGSARSWYSAAGRGFRLDHTLVSAPLRAQVRSVRYSQPEREQRLSDHAPMLVELDMDPHANPPETVPETKNPKKAGPQRLQTR